MGNRKNTVFADGSRLAPRDVRQLVTAWLGGVGLALVLVSYGVYSLISGHAILPGYVGDVPGPDLDVYGPAAIALAVAYIALGVLMHLHWFWGSQPRLHLVRAVVECLALAVFIAALGFGIYRIVL
jgi:hypothetical protein